MRHRGLVAAVVAGLLLLPGWSAPARAEAAFVTRPVTELFGVHQGYGFAGLGVATATGNYVRQTADLTFPVGLLSWTRTYNSLDDTIGAFGRGWSFTFSARLTTGADGSVRFRDDDGRVLTFVPLGGGAYQRPPDLGADLTGQADGSFTLRFLSGEVWTFDASGRATGRRSEGQSVAFEYDASGRLTSASHSAGYRLDLTYDDGSRIVKATAGDGRAVTYAYAEDGTLASATGPGSLQRYAADSSGRLRTVIDAEDRSLVTNTYDAAGRVSHQELGAGGAVDLAYQTDTGLTTMTLVSSRSQVAYQQDQAGRLVQLTDPAGRSTRQTFDASGRLLSLTTLGGSPLAFAYDARGNLASSAVADAVTTYEHDAQDRLTRMTDPAGGSTTFSYTGDGRVPTEVTDPAGGTTTYTVTNGLVTEAVDPAGGRTTFRYDGGRRLVSVTDPVGGSTTYGYDAAGHTTAVTTALGNTTRYQYDPAGRVLSSTDPSGATTSYRYSAAGLLLEVTDPTGAVTSSVYDAAGHRLRSTDAVGRTTTYTYDADGNLDTTTNPAGGVSRYGYDQFGRVSTVTDPAGTVVRYQYDADGRQTERTEPIGTTATSYDGRGNVATTTDALGRVTRYEYDAAGRLVAVTDPTGATWRIGYDGAGRIVSRTDPLGNVTTYTYDRAGRLLTVTDPLGHTTTYSYDAAGRVVQILDPLAGITRYTYDADGHKTSETTPAGLVTRYTYDANGRLLTSTDPRGGVTRYGYNARGQRISTTTPSGAVQRVEYDGASQLVRAIDANGRVTGYEYDVAGNLTTLTEPGGAVTRYTYDTGGRQTSSTDPLGRVTRQTYDTAGNLTAVTDPDGRTTRMIYDADSELLQRVGADGTTVTFTYDAAGRRASMTDGTGTTRYGYDAASQLTSFTGPDGSAFALGYDAAGRRTSLRYPDSLDVAYRYDANDRLVGLTDPKAGDATYTLDPDGRLLGEQLPGGWTRSYTYTAGLLTRYQEAHGASTTQDSTLTRDAEGRIARQAGPGQDLAFGYDKAGELLTVTGQPGGDLVMSYDANGNRTGIKRAGVQSTLGYDAADELVSVDTGPKHVSYTYDGSGRLLTRVGRDQALDVTYDSLSVTYDSLGRVITKVRTKGGVTRTEQLRPNGDGLPTQVDITRDPGSPPPQTSSQRLAWSAGDAVPQILTDGTADFVYGYGRAVVDTPDGSATFSRDVYGSTLRTAETAAWAQAPSYDVFGDPQNADVPALDVPGFGYRGELSDDDSVYLRARDYDTTVARFTTRDPAAVLVGQTDPASPYVYANDSPVNFVDPQGLFSISDVIGQLLGQLLLPPGGFGFDCDDDNPGNSIERHDKCFQGGGPMRTRGYISQDCLDADPNCLEGLWNSHQPERAAQAFTINELNRRRESWWNRVKDDQLGFGTAISQDVDWEVGNSDTDAEIGFFGFRIDIVTDERNIFEVKRFEGPQTTAEVDAQLARYESTVLLWYGVVFVPGTELQDWANAFVVFSNWFKRQFDIGPDLVYVWGLGNPAGHVYFATKEKTPSRVRAAAEAKRAQDNPELPCNICIPIPPILRAPIDDPVPALA